MPKALFLTILLGSLTAPRLHAQSTPPPEVKAASVVVIDARTGEVLFQRNPNEPRPVASTQKLLTALLVAEQGNLEKQVVIQPEDEATEPTTLQLRPGTSYPRSYLLQALLVKSANDVARALARDVGGSIEGFAELMNLRARALGANSSRFLNPNGLPIPGQYSTASDMAKIARAAHANPVLRPIMTIKFLPFRYADGRVHMLQNTNRTMRENWFCTGMKTGYTDAAKHCLVSSGEYNGREVICVILGGSKERVFNDSARMLRWALGLPQESISVSHDGAGGSKPLPKKHQLRHLKPRSTSGAQ